ncbi:hypothetical protein [Anaerostipes sp.]|uniref:hypothetical protein n=1 Tax=Anaerostipes sp. TaxID=1872530 RepID=UPI0025C579A3|nr:hypothetical protein [Anaerostipes sp.]MBS7008126.1 hypothetical protein [Anaerostipes sp.]
MKRFSLRTLLTIALMAFGLFLFSPVDVSAKNPKEVTLKPGKTYKKYDITGDKKKDKILIKLTSHKNNPSIKMKTAVYVNGRKVYSKKGYSYGITAKIYTLKNKKPFLYLNSWADNGDGPVNALFRYKSKKLKKVINFQTLFGSKYGTYGTHPGGSVVKVKGNTVTARFDLMSWTIGPSSYEYQYKYKKGTLKRTSSAGKVYTSLNSSTATAKKNIKVYRTAKISSSFTVLKKGQKVQFIKSYVKGKHHFLKIRMSNKKTGWIKGQIKYSDFENRMFQEVIWAG